MLTVKKLQSTVPYGANTYLISSGEDYAVIDPAAPPDESFDLSKVRYVLLTHSHFDHILEIDTWVKGDCQVLIAKEELEYLKDASLNCYKLFFGVDKGYFGQAKGLSDKDVIKLGKEEILFRRTPGHTPGSGMYLSGKYAFVGDTVFAGGGYGRFDLPGGNYSMLSESIEQVMSMDEDIYLFPGHGPHTTQKEFKRDFRR